MDLTKGRVNVSVANLYQKGTYHSEIVSQGLLGEEILIERKEKEFSIIQLPDGYSGWISNNQWVLDMIRRKETMMIRSHFLSVYTDLNVNSITIRDATVGTKLYVCDRREGWVQIELPDGQKGWVEENKFGSFPDSSRIAVKELAEEFLGYPYFWGGRSPKGFDCSGLIQRVFGLLGNSLPRDTWMQHRDGTYVSDKPEEAMPGDLYFFSENGSRITHVGLATGNSCMIHARGLVRMNSLNPRDEDYSPELHATFVDVRTYF